MKRPRALLLILLALCLPGCPDRTPKRAAPAPEPPHAPQAPTQEGKTSPPPATDDGATPALPPDKGPALPALPALDAMKFRVVNQTLWVSSPQGSVSLNERASKVERAAPRTDSILVTWSDELSCAPEESHTFTRNFLQARLENTRAYQLYKEANFADAARGFRRATELDPHYPLARTNWVAALARAGDLATARLAYLRALKIDAVHTYEKLLTDDDFAPLRAKFKKTESAAPAGPFDLKARQLAPYAGFSPTHGLIAALRIENSWGAENWTAVLHVFDQKSRELLGEHTLVDWKDINEGGQVIPARRAPLEARLARFNEIIAALGFSSLGPERRSTFEQVDPERSVREAKLEGLNQSLVADKDTLRLVRGDTVSDTLRSTLPGAEPAFAYAIPEADTLVYFGRYMVSEGCDNGPEARIELFHTKALAQNKGPPKEQAHK